jgi:mannose-6-phosphate isomerase-like protein (cupin superfamily)
MEKPWGSEIDWFAGEHFIVGQFILLEGRRTSLHLHENQTHFWFVESGNGELVIEDTSYLIGPGDSIHIDREQVHRLSASIGNMQIFFVTSGLIDADDVVRFEDDYGRADKAFG